jgi:hypothetical protein
MTDEERQKLCGWLRKCAGVRSDGEAKGMIDAADEIERLAYVNNQLHDQVERLAHIVKEARTLLGENFEREMAND